MIFQKGILAAECPFFGRFFRYHAGYQLTLHKGLVAFISTKLELQQCGNGFPAAIKFAVNWAARCWKAAPTI